MLPLMCCKRLISISASFRNINTNALAALRRKTGYSLSNCRKALELHGNDQVQAEKWLKEQAQAMGWDKVQKLGARSASQGLVGVSSRNGKAVLVEVNCETDFVARNNQFKLLVGNIVECCLNYPVPKHGQFSEALLSSEDLSKLRTLDGQVLGDLTALLIGNVSENIILKRALCCQIFDKNIHMAVDAHPPSNTSQDVLLGKYGSLVVYRTEPDAQADPQLSVKDVGLQLCKHVIGMNPEKIGVSGEDKPTEDIDEEVAMINQEFLLDSSMTVGQFLQSCNTQVLHFKRFECGESVTFSQEKLKVAPCESNKKISASLQ